jgi:hypothetical protein
MSALHLASEPEAQTRSRPSVCLNMVTNGNMLEEYMEAKAKVRDLIAQIHIQNTIAAELRLHLMLAGIIE